MKSPEIIRQGIMQNILKWKLGSASVELQKNRTALDPQNYEELNQLLNKYRLWDQTITNTRLDIHLDLSEIPRDVLITHPAYPKIAEQTKTEQKQQRSRRAQHKCAEALHAIRDELNPGKADDLIQTAKTILPDWQDHAEIREQIENLSVQSDKLASALRIQQEISALRETGGQTAYQKALELLNEYDTLGLETYGMTLIDVQTERDSLLQMMVRADGSSWTFRLTPSASREIIRLEQSIRSLEDAEKKNLRVLINNNARLLTILIDELEHLEPDSEQAIQVTARIAELREKNRQLQTDILSEVASRASEYCSLTRQALEIGELKTAENNLRLARDAGKPVLQDNDEEYLGEVSLPTEVNDAINRLEDELAQAIKTRTQVRKEIDTIRKSFYSDEDLTMNKLFSWKKTLETCYREDPHAPGLEQLIDEVSDRYQSARSYLLEKTVYDIDHDLENEDLARAKARLDSLNTFFSSEEQNEVLKDQLRRINEAETLRRKADSLNEEYLVLYNTSVGNLNCSETDLKAADDLLQRIFELYHSENAHESQELSGRHAAMRRCLELLNSSADGIRLIKNAAAGGEITPEVRKIAEELEGSELYALPEFCELLANFWLHAAQNETADSAATEQYFARASRLASDSGNPSRQNDINSAIAAYNEKNERGRRLNLLTESLKQFFDDKQFIAGIDFINNNITTEDRGDSQLSIWIDRIEQAYRIQQSENLLAEAHTAADAGDFQKAEEIVTRSLDFFYSVEAAQLQKAVTSRREEEEKSLREFKSFLTVDITNGNIPDEKTAAQIRFIRDRLASMDIQNIRDIQLMGDVSALQTQLEMLLSHEANDFNQMKINFQTNLLAGAETLEDAGKELQMIESRPWIQNYRTEILRMKNEKNNTERVYASLSTVISRADVFANQGDFRSAKRILSSFTQENLSGLPGWLSIMKDNEEERLQQLDDKYQDVRSKFDPDNIQTNSMIRKVEKLFEHPVPDADEVFLLQTELQRQRLILEKELSIGTPENVYLSSIAYLDRVAHWAETISEHSFGINFPQEVFPMEPLYLIRKEGKALMEEIPPLLIEIQPVLARENKWLERRTRVRQTFSEINDTFTTAGKLPSSSFNEIEQSLEDINLIVLLPDEQRAVEDIYRMINGSRRKRSLILAAIISFVILLGVLYYFLPQIARSFGK